MQFPTFITSNIIVAIFKKNILKTIRQNDHSERTRLQKPPFYIYQQTIRQWSSRQRTMTKRPTNYSTFLVLFLFQTHHQHIFIRNRYPPSLTKLKNSFIYFPTHQISRYTLLSPFYVDTTQTFFYIFYKTYIYTLTADISLYIVRATPTTTKQHPPHHTHLYQIP